MLLAFFAFAGSPLSKSTTHFGGGGGLTIVQCLVWVLLVMNQLYAVFIGSLSNESSSHMVSEQLEEPRRESSKASELNSDKH